MTTYGYTRVSTAQQADDGESLTHQERSLKGYAMMHGLPDIMLFCERGVSGSVPLAERPSGSVLLSVVQAGDVIVTTKMDRMFRSSIDALSTLQLLKDRGVSLHMLDLGGDVMGSGVAKLVFTILSAVAESERERIRERIRDVKRDQAQRGQYLGGVVPFGYRVLEGQLVLDRAEQTILQWARQQDCPSHRELTRRVNTQFGLSLSHTTLQRALGRTTDV